MALHNIIVERQHTFVICFIERHVKLNKNRPKELNNCIHLVLVHNNGKVKMIASFNLDIYCCNMDDNLLGLPISSSGDHPIYCV